MWWHAAQKTTDLSEPSHRLSPSSLTAGAHRWIDHCMRAMQAAGGADSGGEVSARLLELRTAAIALWFPAREAEELDLTTTAGSQVGPTQST